MVKFSSPSPIFICNEIRCFPQSWWLRISNISNLLKSWKILLGFFVFYTLILQHRYLFLIFRQNERNHNLIFSKAKPNLRKISVNPFSIFTVLIFHINNIISMILWCVLVLHIKLLSQINYVMKSCILLLFEFHLEIS